MSTKQRVPTCAQLARARGAYQHESPSRDIAKIDIARLLKELAKATKGATGHDSTQYGLGRASPQSFYPHHLAPLSSAIVCADALTIRNHAASLAFQLSHGII